MTIHKTSKKRVWTDDVLKKSIECAWTDDDTQEEYSVANNMVEIQPPLESGTLACRGGLIASVSLKSQLSTRTYPYQVTVLHGNLSLSSHSSPREPIPIRSQLSTGTYPYQVTALHGNLSLSSHSYPREPVPIKSQLSTGTDPYQVTVIPGNLYVLSQLSTGTYPYLVTAIHGNVSLQVTAIHRN